MQPANPLPLNNQEDSNQPTSTQSSSFSFPERIGSACLNGIYATSQVISSTYDTVNQGAKLASMVLLTPVDACSNAISSRYQATANKCSKAASYLKSIPYKAILTAPFSFVGHGVSSLISAPLTPVSRGVKHGVLDQLMPSSEETGAYIADTIKTTFIELIGNSEEDPESVNEALDLAKSLFSAIKASFSAPTDENKATSNLAKAKLLFRTCSITYNGLINGSINPKDSQSIEQITNNIKSIKEKLEQFIGQAPQLNLEDQLKEFDKLEKEIQSSELRYYILCLGPYKVAMTDFAIRGNEFTENKDPLSVKIETTTNDLLNKTDANANLTYQQIRDRTEKAKNRLKGTVELFSLHNTVSTLLGSSKTKQEINKLIDKRLSERGIDIETCSTEQRNECKQEIIREIGDHNVTFASLIKEVDAVANSPEERIRLFKQKLYAHIDQRKDINFIKRFFIKLLLPILNFFISFFSKQITDGSLDYIRDQICEKRNDPAQDRIGLELFRQGNETTADFNRYYQRFGNRQRLLDATDGKIKNKRVPQEATKYLEAQLGELKVDYNQASDYLIARCVPPIALETPLLSANKVMSEWANDARSSVEKLFSNILIALPTLCLWTISNVALKPINFILHKTLKWIASFVFKRNHILETAVRKHQASEQTSRFQFAFERIAKIWFEDLSSTLLRPASSSSQASTTLITADQKEDLKEQLDGLINGLQNLAAVRKKTTPDQVNKILNPGFFRQLLQFPDEISTLLLNEPINEALAELISKAFIQALGQKKSEIYLETILSITDTVMCSEAPENDEGFKRQFEMIKQERIEAQNRLLWITTQQAVREFLEKLCIDPNDRSFCRNYIDEVKKKLTGTLDGTQVLESSLIHDWSTQLANLEGDNLTSEQNIQTIASLNKEIVSFNTFWKQFQAPLDANKNLKKEASNNSIHELFHEFETKFINPFKKIKECIFYKALPEDVLSDYSLILDQLNSLNQAFEEPTSLTIDEIIDKTTDIKNLILKLKKEHENKLPRELDQLLSELDNFVSASLESRINSCLVELHYLYKLKEEISNDTQGTRFVGPENLKRLPAFYHLKESNQSQLLTNIQHESGENFVSRVDAAITKLINSQKEMEQESFNNFTANLENYRSLLVQAHEQHEQSADANIHELIHDCIHNLNQGIKTKALRLKREKYLDPRTIDSSGALTIAQYLIYSYIHSTMDKIFDTFKNPKIAVKYIEDLIIKKLSAN